MPLDGNLNTLLARHLATPFQNYLKRLQNRVRDVNALIDSPAALDQYPGRIIPMAYTRTFGPLPLTTARRWDDGAANGFEKLATLASTTEFYVPRSPGNIKVDRRGAFLWQETALTTYINWTWETSPDLGGTTQQEFATQGDILDDVVNRNGGALVMNNNLFLPAAGGNGNFADDQPNVSFELGLFDKKRGRYLHDGTKLPSAVFSGQNFSNRMNASEIAFDANSEIEPRLYVDEIRLREVINSDTLFNTVQFKAWVMISFIGSIEQEMPR